MKCRFCDACGTKITAASATRGKLSVCIEDKWPSKVRKYDLCPVCATHFEDLVKNWLRTEGADPHVSAV